MTRTVLTARQRRVLDLAAIGLSDQAIASETGTTLKGIQHSLNVVYQKNLEWRALAEKYLGAP